MTNTTPFEVVTREQALEALDDMDDFARMAVGVDAKGALETLRRFIEQRSPFPRDGSNGADALVTPTSEQVMAGYDVACRYGVLERRGLELAEEMTQALRLASRHVVVTTNEAGQAVAVTVQSSEGGVLHAIWEAPVSGVKEGANGSV
jgi:hypothetical protein